MSRDEKTYEVWVVRFDGSKVLLTQASQDLGEVDDHVVLTWAFLSLVELQTITILLHTGFCTYYMLAKAPLSDTHTW